MPNLKLNADERAPLLELQEAASAEVVVGDPVDGDRDRELKLQQLEEPEPEAAHELRTLLVLVYPVVVTSALEFLPGLTCIVLAGHMESPLTAQYVVAATLSIMFTNITAYAVGIGLSSALDTLCSQAYGARRADKIGIYFQSGLIVVGLCLIPISILNWYCEGLLVLFGQDAEVSHLAQSFSRWMLPGLPFVFLYELVRKALQAQNIMKPLVTIATISNIVNIATGYWLAYHTSMGFEGIALSRTLGNMILPLLLIPYFWQHPQHLAQWWGNGWDLKAAWVKVGVFLEYGTPGMFMVVLEWWAFEMLTLMAGVLPDNLVAVSAHAVVVNVNAVLYMVFAGFSVAANIRVGNCLGANTPKEAQLACKVSLLFTFAVSVVFAVAMFVLREHLPILFLSDAESIVKAASVMAIWAPFEVLDGLNTTALGVFRGVGYQRVAATTNALAYYAVGMPLAALFAFYFDTGVDGLWVGFGCGVFFSAAVLFALMFGRWKWDEIALDAQRRTAY